MKWLKKKKLDYPIHMTPGDSITLSYNDKEIITEKVTRTMKVDTTGVFEFDNEFGMKRGIGGVFGES